MQNVGGVDTIMVETKTRRRVSRSRKKSRVPLSKLGTSEVVRTVVEYPRRLGELVALLDDSDRGLRGRAAATLARLSESHPGRLLRVLERLREALHDDSAFVRWHLAYTLGKVGTSFPSRAPQFLQDLLGCLDDENRVVRIITAQALAGFAARKPAVVQQLFVSSKHAVPTPVARALRHLGRPGEGS